MANKTKNIQDNLLPAVFNARQNKNWKAIVEAIGNSDQSIADLIVQVKNECFVKTSSGIYLDRNAANLNVSKPTGLSISDINFREYIPIMSYMPKQVRPTIEKLIRLFFLEENTHAYVQTIVEAPYALFDGATLNLMADNQKIETIEFNASDFTDISNATAEEVVSIINRSAEYVYANTYYDNLEQKTYVRVFTKTIGREGFIEILGGTSNIFLKFEGFVEDAGTGTDTQWEITKTGDLVTYRYVGNTSPSLFRIEKGDAIISIIPGNVGSFSIEEIDLSNQRISFRNPEGTSIPLYTQSSSDDVKFFKPYRGNVYKRLSKALVWEVNQNEFKVEMPSMPGILSKELQGAIYLNGRICDVESIPSANELELNDITGWEDSGLFKVEYRIKYPNQYLDGVGVVQEDPTYVYTKSSFKSIMYSYDGISGNTLQNVSPTLPEQAKAINYSILSGERVFTTGTTTLTLASTPSDISIGDIISVAGTTELDGTFTIGTIDTTTNEISFADNRPDYLYTGPGAFVLYEEPGIADSGHIIYQYSASTVDTFTGTYIYDPSYPYTIRSEMAELDQNINIGLKTKIIKIDSSYTLPNSEGFLVFGFGTENEEGPVKYYYIAGNYIYIDSTYSFKNPHLSGDKISLCEFSVQSVTNKSFATYITDPSVAIQSLKESVMALKASGIGLEFLVRYPKPFYEGYNFYE